MQFTGTVNNQTNTSLLQIHNRQLGGVHSIAVAANAPPEESTSIITSFALAFPREKLVPKKKREEAVIRKFVKGSIWVKCPTDSSHEWFIPMPGMGCGKCGYGKDDWYKLSSMCLTCTNPHNGGDEGVCVSCRGREYDAKVSHLEEFKVKYDEEKQARLQFKKAMQYNLNSVRRNPEIDHQRDSERNFKLLEYQMSQLQKEGYKEGIGFQPGQEILNAQDKQNLERERLNNLRAMRLARFQLPKKSDVPNGKKDHMDVD